MFPGVQTHFPGPEGLSASTPILESSAKPRVAAKAKASTGSTRAAGSFEEEPGSLGIKVGNIPRANKPPKFKDAER